MAGRPWDGSCGRWTHWRPTQPTACWRSAAYRALPGASAPCCRACSARRRLRLPVPAVCFCAASRRGCGGGRSALPPPLRTAPVGAARASRRRTAARARFARVTRTLLAQPPLPAGGAPSRAVARPSARRAALVERRAVAGWGSSRRRAGPRAVPGAARKWSLDGHRLDGGGVGPARAPGAALSCPRAAIALEI